jgi:nitroimidazol reductase NimA-like FMN-containing flavoprotein (pyridoxamine 5'-phosphate oxidase superfamily)
MTNGEIEKLIIENFLCRIAFKGEEYPYIAPFQYAFLDGTLYFHFTAYGKKMELLKKEKKVCVEIEQYEPDMNRYMFVTLTGKLSIVKDPNERTKAIKIMRDTGKEKLSENFLVAHGFPKEENWSSFTPEKPLVISKLVAATKSGLKSP